MGAHLSAVAESRVQIPVACKYCKAASAATAATAVILVVSAAEAAKKRKGQKKVTKRKNKVAI